MLLPLIRATPRVLAISALTAGGLVAAPVLASAASVTPPAAAAGAPSMTVAVTDLDGLGGAVRAGHHLQYSLAWATNGQSYNDAWVAVQLDGSNGTALLDQIAPSSGGTVSSALANGAISRSILWHLGHQASGLTGTMSWTAVVSGPDTSAAVPSICAGASLRGPLTGHAPSAVGAPACTAASAACAAGPVVSLQGPATLAPGAAGTYALRVDSPEALSLGIVGVSLPPGFALASSSPVATMQGGLPSINLGGIAAGSVVTASLAVTAATTPGPSTLTVRLIGNPVDGSCTPPNVTATAPVSVVAAAVLGTTTGAPAPAAPVARSAAPVAQPRTAATTATTPLTGVVSTPVTGAGGLMQPLGVLLVLTGSLGLVARRRCRV